MKYIRISESCWSFPLGELITLREAARLKERFAQKRWASDYHALQDLSRYGEEVEVNPKNTYKFFGIRFEKEKNL